MPANIVAIADAVTAELNGTVFSQPFVAQRSYVPTYDLQSMNDLKVTVVPKALSNVALDRSRDSYEYLIDVAVQKKTTAQPDSVDPLMLLVEEIADHLRAQPLASFPGARCMNVENSPVFAPDHLQELRQFTSVLTLTFRLWR
ncbi:MAG: hypothetical protein KGQ51_19205 [Planctomycetes bacterium]|nr:hypothetical protein [Planctomycetota bacterium]